VDASEHKPKVKVPVSVPVDKSQVPDLAAIVAAKRPAAEAAERHARAWRARAEAAPPPRPFRAALRGGGEVQVIAEIKRRSPSAGPIRPDADPAALARAYATGGAAALSVLTDPVFFDGSPEALIRARAATDLPVLRKDFLFSPAQIYEARAWGADAVLLIVRLLDDVQLRDLQALARGLGMDALVEVHDESELERALALGANPIGVNHRDLDRFVTDLGISARLAPRVPAEVVLVAESGLATRADVEAMGRRGVDAVLIGEGLMRQADVAEAVAALRGCAVAPRR